MTEEIPEETGDPVDIDIKFEPDDVGIKVTAELGKASIVVEHAWESAEQAALLVQALPEILAAVQAALESQEAQQ